jgi:hypothetical protein
MFPENSISTATTRKSPASVISGTTNEITAATPGTLTVNIASDSTVPVPITGSAALTKSGSRHPHPFERPHLHRPHHRRSGKLLLDLSALTTPTNLLNPASPLIPRRRHPRTQRQIRHHQQPDIRHPTLAPNTSSTIVLTPNGATSLSLTLGDTWTVGENATLLIDLSAGNCAVLSNPALTGGFLPGVSVKDSIATGPATVVAGQVVRYIPPTLTSSSNDANLGFSSLNSTYPGGILDWTDGGFLTNRAVHRLILDTTLHRRHH